MKSNRNVEVILLSCPSKVMDYPSLALPMLQGYLKKKGVSVKQIDMSIEIKDILISEKGFESLLNVLPYLIRVNKNCVGLATNLKLIYYTLLNHDNELKEIIKTKKAAQNRSYDNIFDNKDHINKLNIIFNISKLLDKFFTYIYYYFDYFKENNIQLNIFDYIRERISLIIKSNPLIVGFSLITTQTAFSIWFASMLKESGYKKNIIMGGPQITKFRTSFLKYNPFIDFLIYGEGEDSLYRLIKSLKNEDNGFEKIPRLIYRDGKNIYETKNIQIQSNNFKLVGFPYYDDLDLSKYLTPVLPIIASYNCPWKKCKFCAHKTAFCETYKERDTKDIIDEMVFFNKKYGVVHFHFADETIVPQLGEKIASEISEKNYPFLWMSFARLEEGFSEETLTKLFKGGARVIEWGLESGSNEMLRSMKKGITVQNAQKILQNARRLGIKNKLLTWHDYIGESLKNMLDTVNFVHKNVFVNYAIPMYTLKNKFVLQLGSKIYDEIIFNKKTEKFFNKIWMPESDYSINAEYQLNSLDYVKDMIINTYFKQLDKICEDNNIFIASNECVTFDLVLTK